MKKDKDDIWDEFWENQDTNMSTTPEHKLWDGKKFVTREEYEVEQRQWWKDRDKEIVKSIVKEGEEPKIDGIYKPKSLLEPKNSIVDKLKDDYKKRYDEYSNKFWISDKKLKELEKENNRLKHKLNLIESDPEAYKRLKEIDPYDEENWE